MAAVPLVVFVLVLLLIIPVMILIVPWTVARRYRAGTAQRHARGWAALSNLFGFGISAAIILTVAAIGSIWVPSTFAYSAAGLAGGGALGGVGLWLTRWERTESGLLYTPNRWLVLIILVAVVLRLLYGLWRISHVGDRDGTWLAASGLAGSLAAGAVVLGYYLAFWTGIWIRARRRYTAARHDL